MSNPWPNLTNNVPPGCAADAVQKVREALGLTRYYMTQRLGITVTELTECETAHQWPRSENARQKLLALADQAKVDIGQQKEEKPEEPSLF